MLVERHNWLIQLVLLLLFKMILIRLKFNGNRFTSVCCSDKTRLDVLSDNTVPPDERGDDMSGDGYYTPRGYVDGGGERGTSETTEET